MTKAEKKRYANVLMAIEITMSFPKVIDENKVSVKILKHFVKQLKTIPDEKLPQF